MSVSARSVGWKSAAAIVLVMGLLAIPFHYSSDWLETSILIGIYALMAISVGVSYGLAGILSVAQGSFAAFGAYTTAILSIRFGLNPFVSVIPAVLVPAFVAYPLARLVTRMPPIVLALVTLIFGEIFGVALRQGGSLTGGYIGLSGIPALPLINSELDTYLLVWGIVAVVVLLCGNLYSSTYGAKLKTIRSDPLRALADGVNVQHLRSLIFSLAAGIAGLAGWIYAHYLGFLGPTSLDPSTSLSVLLMAIVGGVSTVLGPILGAAILTLCSTLLPGSSATGMFYGGILVFVLLVAPKGLESVRLFAIRKDKGKDPQRLVGSSGQAPARMEEPKARRIS